MSLAIGRPFVADGRATWQKGSFLPIRNTSFWLYREMHFFCMWTIPHFVILINIPCNSTIPLSVEAELVDMWREPWVIKDTLCGSHPILESQVDSNPFHLSLSLCLQLLDYWDGAWESPSTKRRDTGAKERAKRSWWLRSASHLCLNNKNDEKTDSYIVQITSAKKETRQKQ